MANYEGSIKALSNGNKIVYPITMTSAIFNEDGTHFSANQGISSNIMGKKLLFIGDSMSAPFKWQQVLVDKYGINGTESYNHAGNGWSIQAINVKVYKHLQPLDKTKDGVIIFFLGTNDAHYIYSEEQGTGVSIPGYLEGNYDDDVSLYETSFHASVKMLLKTVLEAYNGKPILWVGSPRRGSAFDIPPTGINAKLQKFTDYIAQHCKDYGIKFLDLYNEYNCITKLSDGIHPTDAMYKQLGSIIGNTFNNMN